MDGVDGVAFAVWAPGARSVRIVGDFDRWDGRLTPMRSLGASGVWELFVPDIGPGELYKYEVLGADGSLRLKADPLGFAMQLRPESASRVWQLRHAWGDEAWLAERAESRPDAHARWRSTRSTSARGCATRTGRGSATPSWRRSWRSTAVGSRFTPRRAPPGGRASVRRLVGLPGHRLLRAHGALRHPRRLRRLCRHAPPGGHRRHRRLGAGPLPARRLRPAPLRRHRALRARGSAPWRAPRLGHAHLQLRTPRGPQLPRRQRPVLARRVPRRWAAGRRGRLDALPRLLAQAPANGSRTGTAAARTSRRSRSCAR